MLASPVESAEEAMKYFSGAALVEDKYDGIRAQAHKRGREARLFSRTLDEVKEFPELLAPLEALPGEFILDGEVVGWRGGRVHKACNDQIDWQGPFAILPIEPEEPDRLGVRIAETATKELGCASVASMFVNLPVALRVRVAGRGCGRGSA